MNLGTTFRIETARKKTPTVLDPRVAFIRKKTIGGRVYRYEVESVRDEAGNVRQKVLRYLGAEEPVYGTDKSRRSEKGDA